MPDWDVVTRGWVDRGLVEEHKREALLDELLAMPQQGQSPPFGPVVTLLIACACWLIVGGLAAGLTSMYAAPPDAAYAIVALMGLSGVGLMLLGGALRAVPRLLPLARGLLTASPPLLSFGIFVYLDSQPLYVRKDGVFLLLLPPLLSLPVAFVEGSRSFSASSALTLAIAASLATSTSQPEHLYVAVAGIGLTLLAAAALSALTPLLPARSQAFQAAMPSAFLYLLVATLAMPSLFRPLWGSLGIYDVNQIEKSLLVLLEAVILIVFGAISRSGYTLVPAVLLIGGSTVSLAGAVGSWAGGALSLGGLGGLFLVGTSVLWVIRAREREAPGPSEGREKGRGEAAARTE